MKAPLVLKVIAVLFFVGAAEAIWRLEFFLFEYDGFGGYGFGLFVFLQAVLLICLGVGILRLRPTWRLIALGCCWFVFILFAVALLCWYFWPQIVGLELLLVIGAVFILSLWLFHVLQRADIRALFTSLPHATPRI